MDIQWEISPKDIEVVQAICHQQKDHPIYKERKARNLSDAPAQLNKNHLWKCIITCLLTTQQPSSRESNINLFLKNDFKSIDLDTMEGLDNVNLVITSHLTNKGIRRNVDIGDEAKAILSHLNDTNWALLESITAYGKAKGVATKERELASSIAENKSLKGLGPKQARNLLQMIGYTRYEIPIDTRITGWLNENNIFPFRISSKGLSDNAIYGVVNDAIIKLCEKAAIFPCLFDAAVFSLREKAKKR